MIIVDIRAIAKYTMFLDNHIKRKEAFYLKMKKCILKKG